MLRRNHHVAGILNGEAKRRQRQPRCSWRGWLGSAKPCLTIYDPPVLLIPDALSRDDCARLIEIFETRGQTFVDPQPIQDFLNGADFKMRIPEHGREDRVDHFFFEKSTIAFLHNRLNRVLPEIVKAFHYRVTTCETWRGLL